MADPAFFRELADALEESVQQGGDVTLGPTDAEACAKALRFQAACVPVGTIGAPSPQPTRAVA